MDRNLSKDRNSVQDRKIAIRSEMDPNLFKSNRSDGYQPKSYKHLGFDRVGPDEKGAKPKIISWDPKINEASKGERYFRVQSTHRAEKGL